MFFQTQAVNNFKKERVGGNSLRKKPAITTPQNLTPLPGPALPPLTLKKLLQPQHMQQVKLLTVVLQTAFDFELFMMLLF